MATVIKDLGAVSAYAYAVEKGYTGTEEEFAELMASYAAVGQNAAASATAAEASKVAAKASEDNAADSESAAGASATSAANSAGAASRSAGSASSYAATASSKASEASASASRAAGSATTASAKASAASASATAAGDAKTAAETAQGKAEDAQAAAETAQSAAETAAASVSASAAQIQTNTNDISDLKSAVNGLEVDHYKAYATDTASGPIASFPDGADDIPVKDLSVGIEPVQSGSGDPSPDNIRPISGWTGAEVTRTGRNLLDTKNFAPTSSTSSGITLIQNQDGSFKASGTATGTVNFWLRGSWGGTNPVLKLYAGKTYFIKDCMLYNGTSAIVPYIYMGNSGTYTPTADTVVTGVRASCPVGTTLDQTIYPYVTDSSDTEWQEFGDTYSITFPTEAGTVYGGTLDVTTGKLTVDRAMVDLGTLTWTLVSSSVGANRRFSTNGIMSVVKKTANTSVVSNALCSNYKTVSVNASWIESSDNVVDVEMSGTLIILDTSKIGYTAEQFKTAMSGVQLVYELATPIVYDLTPTEVTTLLAQNNIWADCGDSTVEYRADTKLYIDKKIAALAAAMN